MSIKLSTPLSFIKKIQFYWFRAIFIYTRFWIPRSWHVNLKTTLTINSSPGISASLVSQQLFQTLTHWNQKVVLNRKPNYSDLNAANNSWNQWHCERLRITHDPWIQPISINLALILSQITRIPGHVRMESLSCFQCPFTTPCCLSRYYHYLQDRPTEGAS